MEPNEFDSILFGATYAKYQYAYSDSFKKIRHFKFISNVSTVV